MSDNGRIQCAGLVLAGGGAVRLGGVDKAQIQIGDQTLLLRAIGILGQFAETIAISGGPNPTGTKMHGHPILKDISPGGGPLAGIAAGLSWAAEEGFEWLAERSVPTSQEHDVSASSPAASKISPFLFEILHKSHHFP